MTNRTILFLMSVVFSVSAFAQYDDDMYFTPRKKTAHQVVIAYEQDNSSSDSYYTGKLRDVDEYNRRGSYRPSSAEIVDTIYTTPSNIYRAGYTTGYSQGYNEGVYDEWNMSFIHRPFFNYYNPWYYHYRYDPWYWDSYWGYPGYYAYGPGWNYHYWHAGCYVPYYRPYHPYRPYPYRPYPYRPSYYSYGTVRPSRTGQGYYVNRTGYRPSTTTRPSTGSRPNPGRTYTNTGGRGGYYQTTTTSRPTGGYTSGRNSYTGGGGYSGGSRSGGSMSGGFRGGRGGR